MTIQCTYIYDGVLSKDTTEYIRDMIQTLKHVVEVKTPEWRNVPFIEWSHQNITPIQGTGENCMGQTYEKTYHPYGMVSNGDTMFVFFNTAKEKEAFIRDFANAITNSNPIHQTRF